jgi:two-component system chemotaxis response regulator CheB
MNEPAIKVILIEDSGFMRILISEILRRDNDIALIATAANGKDGLQKVKSMNPDVIVTDMIMPEYDGLYVVREVMNGPATPVILLSSLERKDEQIFEALKAGAFDFVEKPQARLDDDDGQPYALIPLIKAAAQSGRKTIQGSSSKNFNHHTFEKELPYDIVVIGSSTGGPSAIAFSTTCRKI